MILLTCGKAWTSEMKKLKHESELFKAALLAGVQYAEGARRSNSRPPIRRASKRCTCIACWCMTK